ncbi:hypothetical protein [Granulicoccus phenolivorans]|uniref:hypothetical protein n=1 Tax=Granulicoccus phenolivorans TaxID=266854 RepID=UPI00041283C7|nr:hypothetical protein [Granulicoccus phenolivorans]
MGTTGLIFGAIALVWLVVLVPGRLTRSATGKPAPIADPQERFADVRVIRAAAEAPAEEAEDPQAGVSTPLTRKADLAALRLVEQRATGLRRNILLSLLLSTVVLAVFVVTGSLPWWALAVGGGLLLAWFPGCRLSVVLLDREIAKRRAAILDAGTEETVAIRPAALPAESGESRARTLPLGGAVKTSAGSLWDPLPITTPTYVSRPLAPRTVRTIDLSGPPVGAAPVTADEQPGAALEPVELPRAVGE